MKPNTYSVNGSPGAKAGRKEADIMAAMRARTQPEETALHHARQTGVDMEGLVAGFANSVVQVRAGESASTRTDALNEATSVMDKAGVLNVLVRPAEASATALEAINAAEHAMIAEGATAVTALENLRDSAADSKAWNQQVGANRHLSPWPTPFQTAAILVLTLIAEMSATSVLLDGPPIAGLPQPWAAGLIFALISVCIGGLAAFGVMMAVHRHRGLKYGGWAVIAAAVIVWAFLAITGAHMRRIVEAGVPGDLAELVLDSLGRGILLPFLNPLASLIAVTSAATVLITVWKVIAHFGAPLGHRKQDGKRRWAESQLGGARAAAHGRVMDSIERGRTKLDDLDARAHEPVRVAEAAVSELQLIALHHREAQAAIMRCERAILNEYLMTMRLLRPEVRLPEALPEAAPDTTTFGDTSRLRACIDHLTEAADAVSVEVDAARAILRAAELRFAQNVENLYRFGSSGHGSLPAIK